MEHGLERKMLRPLGFWHLVLTLSIALLIRLCGCAIHYILKAKSVPARQPYGNRNPVPTRLFILEERLLEQHVCVCVLASLSRLNCRVSDLESEGNLSIKKKTGLK